MEAKQIAMKLFQGMNDQDLETLAELCSEDVVFYFPKTKPMEGKDRVIRFLKILFAKFPVLNFEVGRVVADERSAAVEWTNKGHDRSKNPYENAGVTFIELNDGKISYMSDTFKNTNLF